MAKKDWSATPLALYESLSRVIKYEPYSDEVTQILHKLGMKSYEYLVELDRRDLVSRVADKSYFSITNGERFSRAINSSLFTNVECIDSFLSGVLTNNLDGLSSFDITKSCYTLAISFAAAVDILNPRDQKTPATYYEYLVTHLLTRTLKTRKADHVRAEIEAVRCGFSYTGFGFRIGNW